MKSIRGTDGGRSSGLKRHHICASLDASLPQSPDLVMINAKKLYFEFVNLGAMKIIVTTKFERKAFELNIDDPS